MILFIDDEARRVESYVDELADSGYQVEFRSDIVSAIEFFEQNYTEIDLLILDVMMPPGDISNIDETEFGLRTGIVFYRKIRQTNHELPIIVFTNVSVEDLVEKIDDEKALFLQKENFLPFELVEEIEKILKTEHF